MYSSCRSRGDARRSGSRRYTIPPFLTFRLPPRKLLDRAMKITDVTTTILHDPDSRALQDSTISKLWSGGATDIFVHIQTDEGVEGLGVCQPRPAYAIREIVDRELKHLLVGEDPFNIEKLWNDMFWGMRNYFRKGIAVQALSAIDVALWDLKAKALNLPLYRLLNPRYESVPVYGSGGWTNMTVDELVEEATGFVERGIRRYKMKVGKDFGQSEREDIERLKAVREAVGDASTTSARRTRSRARTGPRSRAHRSYRTGAWAPARGASPIRRASSPSATRSCWTRSTRTVRTSACSRAVPVSQLRLSLSSASTT